MGTTEQQGWLKIFYQFREWEWYGDPNMVALFIHLLLRANFKTVRWRGEVYGRGVIITSREELSRETGISERTIRTCLTRLKSTNEITIQTTKHGSIITIMNYDKYQSPNSDSDQENNDSSDQQPTNSRPTTDQQLTTCKEVKNIYLVVESLTREEFFADFFAEHRRATIEAICMNSHTDEATLRRLAKEVLDDWQGTSLPTHRDLHDAQKHLLSQIRIKLNLERQQAARRRKDENRAPDRAPRNVNDNWSDFTMPTQ